MTGMQFSIDFTTKRPPEVQERIAEGMQAADDHANELWKLVVDASIAQAARKKPEITVDDVLDELDLVNQERKSRGLDPVRTHHVCAIGAAMVRAKNAGLLSPTDRVIRSTRSVKHGNRHSVWLSNHFRSRG